MPLSIRNLTQALRSGGGAVGKSVAEALDRIETEINRYQAANDARFRNVLLVGDVSESGEIDTNLPSVTIADARFRHVPPLVATQPTFELIVDWEAPAAFEDGWGVAVYIDFPAKQSGKFSLSGTQLSGIPLSGAFSPVLYGRFAWDSSASTQTLRVPGLVPPKEDTPLAVYLATFSPVVDAKVSLSSPSETLTITPYPLGTRGEEYAKPVAVGTPTTSEESVAGVKKAVVEIPFTVDPTDRFFGGVKVYACQAGSTPKALEGTFSTSPARAVVDMPTSVQSWEFYLVSYSTVEGRVGTNTLVYGVTPKVTVSIGTASGTIDLGKVIVGTFDDSDFAFDTSTGKFKVNNVNLAKVLTTSADNIDFEIVDGKFRIKNLDLSKVAEDSIEDTEFKLENGKFTINGVDLSKAIASTVGAALSVTSGVLGVAPGGITESLVDNFAISKNKLANAPIIDAVRIENAAITNAKLDRASASKIAIVDADIMNLAANKVTAGTLAAGVVYAGTVAATQVAAGTLSSGVIYSGTINASQVNAGNFNGCTMTLNLNGVTTSFDNVSAGTFGLSGAATGLRVTNNSTGRSTYITDGYVTARGGSGVGSATASLYADNFTGGVLNLSNGSGGVVISLVGNSGGITTNGLISTTGAITASGTITGGSVNSGAYLVSGLQVVGARLSTVSTVPAPGIGFADSFNTSDRACLNNLVTAVNAIINRIQSHGLIY